MVGRIPLAQANARPQDYRCPNCGRLLCRAILPIGSLVEIRCPKCSRTNTYPAQPVPIDLTGQTCYTEINQAPEPHKTARAISRAPRAPAKYAGA